MAQHDNAYKNLYSHPQMVVDLLRGFIDMDWVQELDFTHLEKLNNSYVSDDLRDRAGDVVWRVKFRDQWLYVYLLLEFQSTVDNFMAVRIMTYVGLLYQDLIKAKQLPKHQRLPPVFPVVLYNGTRPWTAAESLDGLFQPMPEALQSYQPRQSYWLIDENRYSESELAELENLTAALIRAEIAEDLPQLTRVIANLRLWLAEPEQAELRRAFVAWLTRVIIPANIKRSIDEAQNLMEIENMLSERVKDWTKGWVEQGMEQGIKQGMEQGIKQGIEQGIEQGVKQGIEQGVKKGEVLLLSKLLSKRFGPLPEWVHSQLESASAEELDIWAERIITTQAKNLEQFFQAD